VSPSFQFGKIRSGGGTPDPDIEGTVTVKCRSCEEPMWDGPCNCKGWCKSRVCKASFMGKMDELIAEAQASPVLTMDQWYERTQQGRRERAVRERVEASLVPGPYPHCICTWCREIDRRIPATWHSMRTRYYGVAGRRDDDNSVPLVQELQRNSPYPDGDYDT